ncbi:mannose-1-phosphate guanylyltransferase/mannose-6-phosphate isomerase [Marinobacter orientalis]|uniref:Alginate biosynthesis protein AlgA n=1 Tax=Marinobacter orientalis TaxID=1928859 RepID=A0A7Y0RBX4_9GAMM|nr:mannose-1-phosphate guanylyltransferase/mannose-6-phosphate isomerase [Marinobacter orientalis]NMT63406.1 mannose-1-phosphate guanylyltransferase/mannose-6-phosphate isomerase [Marinobacter orientalis]TGX48472.1 mannose-1-phosphate guanylyltransferase/mannose-6-phosphate isomerase [Marinobacter orientalis]
MLAVILSGGSGTRLWPLSREAYPKQFLPVVSDETLLAETIDRGLTLDGKARVMAITNEEHRFVVAAHLQAQAPERTAGIILEPVGRNTAPAIALAALSAAEENPEELLLVMPSDHVLKNLDAFRQAVSQGAEAARAGKLVTFGIVPSAPHTGYGYIKAGQAHEGFNDVAAFVEKPDEETARRYLEEGDYFWNSGMFLFRADRYLEELESQQPEMIDACRAAWKERNTDMDFTRVGSDAFKACPDNSVDYAVMEKTRDAVVVPLDAGWSDVGSWSALWDIQPHDGNNNVCRGDVITEDVSGSYIHSEGRLIAALGITDHVIVETDDVVLVADRNRVQDVKKLVAQVRDQGRHEHRFHKKVHRPWGTYEGIAMGGRFQVKRITVNPGASLSLQKHHHRAEHWVVVKGTATVNRGDEVLLLTEDQSTYIPLGITHRLTNPGVIPLELIEVQTGSYLGEDDIVRFEDTYNRV